MILARDTDSLRNGVEGVAGSDDNAKVGPRVEDGKLVREIEVNEVVDRAEL
jgi:hypothetical protein